MTNECDASYKLLFSTPEFVRTLIRGFVPDPWVQSLNYGTLEKVPCHYVTDDLRQRASDVVWRAKVGGEWVYLYLLIEFQSSVDQHMAVRIAGYLSLLYQDLIRACDEPRDRLLPPVLPIVFYTGNRKWTAATDIKALIAQMPDAVAKYQPRLSYLLIDSSQYRKADLLKMNNLVACVIGLEHPASEKAFSRLMSQLRRMVGSNVPLKEVAVRWLRGLATRQSRNASVPRVLTDGALTELGDFKMTWAECFDEARRKSRQAGLREGLREGLRKGAALALRKLLVRRFGGLPPEIESRIDAASEEQVDVWMDRVFYSDSLAEIFRD